MIKPRPSHFNTIFVLLEGGSTILVARTLFFHRYLFVRIRGGEGGGVDSPCPHHKYMVVGLTSGWRGHGRPPHYTCTLVLVVEGGPVGVMAR